MSREAMQKVLDALERYEYAEARVILRAALQEPVQQVQPVDVAAWCEEAAENVADWGGYASAYFQEKHRLQEDIDKWKKRAEQCRNAAPQGYVMVPVEPTEEMLDAGRAAGDFHIMHYDGTDKPGTPRYSLRQSWTAMLSAAKGGQ